MSRHHNRPRPWDAPPGAVPGELRGQAGPWLAEHPGPAPDNGHVITSTRSLLLDPPGLAPGWQEAIPVPAPPAGAGWSRAVPGPYSERLVAVTWTLTASPAVASRIQKLRLTDAQGRAVITVPGIILATAGQVITAQLAPGMTTVTAAVNGDFPGSLPDLLVPPGFTWQTISTALDAADQVSAIMLTVHRFPAAQAGDPRPRHHEEST